MQKLCQKELNEYLLIKYNGLYFYTFSATKSKGVIWLIIRHNISVCMMSADSNPGFKQMIAMLIYTWYSHDYGLGHLYIY